MSDDTIWWYLFHSLLGQIENKLPVFSFPDLLFRFFNYMSLFVWCSLAVMILSSYHYSSVRFFWTISAFYIIVKVIISIDLIFESYHIFWPMIITDLGDSVIDHYMTVLRQKQSYPPVIRLKLTHTFTFYR